MIDPNEFAEFANLYRYDPGAYGAALKAAKDAGALRPKGLFERVASGVLAFNHLSPRAWTTTPLAQRRLREWTIREAAKGSEQYLLGRSGNAYTQLLELCYGKRPLIEQESRFADQIRFVRDSWAYFRSQHAAVRVLLVLIYLGWLSYLGYLNSSPSNWSLIAIPLVAPVPWALTLYLLLSLAGLVGAIASHPRDSFKAIVWIGAALLAGAAIAFGVNTVRWLLEARSTYAINPDAAWPDFWAFTLQNVDIGWKLPLTIIATGAAFAFPFMGREYLVTHGLLKDESLLREMRISGEAATGRKSDQDAGGNQSTQSSDTSESSETASAGGDPGASGDEAEESSALRKVLDLWRSDDRLGPKRAYTIMETDEAPVDVLSRIALSLSQLSTVNPWTVKPHIRQALDEISFVAHGKFSGDYGTLVAGTGDNAAVLFDVSERPKSVQGHIALRCRIFPEESDAGERLYVLLEFTEVGKPLGAMWLHWQSDAYVAQTVEELSEDLGMFIFQWKWASHCWARYDIYSHRPRTFASFAYEDIS